MKSRLFAVLLLTLVYSFVLTGCSGPSKGDIAEAKESCTNFYQQERARLSAVVEPIDHWTKDGAIVVELGVKESASSTSYTSNLCVYDKKKGTVALPGAFNRQRWEK